MSDLVGVENPGISLGDSKTGVMDGRMLEGKRTVAGVALGIVREP